MRRSVAILFVVLLFSTPSHLTAGPKKKKHADHENIGPRDINKGSWNLYSPEVEMAVGEQLAFEAMRTMRLLEDTRVTAYVTQVAERVTRHSDLRMPLRVHLIDSDEVNAFTLPGGYLFMSRGLLLVTQSEAELAGVISHEVAHLAARHATKRDTKVRLWNWMYVPLLMVGGPVALAVRNGMALAAPLTFLKFSRDAEREADFLGLQYHYASGYDPGAFVQFFERVSPKEKGPRSSIANAFSTHPMTKDRILSAERTIEEILPPREEYVVTTAQYDEVRAYLDRLPGEGWRRKEVGGPVLRRRTAPDRFASLTTRKTTGKGETQTPF